MTEFLDRYYAVRGALDNANRRIDWQRKSILITPELLDSAPSQLIRREGGHVTLSDIDGRQFTYRLGDLDVQRNVYPAELIGWATFRGHGRYRYLLGREIADAHLPDAIWGMVLFVGLNPSKAGADRTDPTATRMRNFAEAWGYRRMGIVNLFAHIATDPKELLKLDYAEAVGPDNDRHIANAAREATLVVAAWGSSYPRGLARRVGAVLDLLESVGPVHHLGLTKNGDPRHPLYLRGDTLPARWWR